MSRFAVQSLLGCALVISHFGTNRAAADEAHAQKQKDLIKKVAKRLLAVADKVPGMEWPPDVQYVDSPKVNAFASTIRKDGKVYPIVRIFDGMMTKVIKGDEDRLAYVLGHELGHVIKRHVLVGKGETA